MIADLLVLFGNGWRITKITRWQGRDCWFLERENNFAPEHVPIPDGWEKPQ